MHSSNSSACLSTDSSTVTAKDGRAVFIGSFCAPVSSIALSFTTQSKVSSSMVGGPTTTTFDVTGMQEKLVSWLTCANRYR